MTRGKISLGRAWWSRVFPGWAGPEEVDDVAIATIPIGGAGRYNDLQFEAVGGTAVATLSLAVVGDEVQRWVPYLSAFHLDPALTTHIRIVLRDRGGNEVVVSGGRDVTEDGHISIRRPLVVQSGWQIRMYMAAAAAAGKSLKLRSYFVETPIGEYVAPL